MQTVEALGVLGAPPGRPHRLAPTDQPVRLGLVSARSGRGGQWRRLRLRVLGLVCGTVQPGGFEAAWLATVTDTLYFGLLPLLLLLFPDGQPPSPRWRPVVWATVVVAVAWTLATAVAPGPMIEGTPNLIVSLYGTPAELARWLAIELERAVRLLMAVGGLSLLARLRHARGRQRQQVKWLTYVGVLIATALVRPTQVAPDRAGASRLPRGHRLGHLPGHRDRHPAPSAVRHRPADQPHPGLWAAHRASWHWSMPAGYSCWVSCSTPAGGESALAVAASTLAVAALFRPLRRRVQTAVDRRFNRRRYDAAKTAEAFSGRLREHIDLETLSTELLAVVDQTMQPTRVSVWLRPTANQAGP